MYSIYKPTGNPQYKQAPFFEPYLHCYARRGLEEAFRTMADQVAIYTAAKTPCELTDYTLNAIRDDIPLTRITTNKGFTYEDSQKSVRRLFTITKKVTRHIGSMNADINDNPSNARKYDEGHITEASGFTYHDGLQKDGSFAEVSVTPKIGQAEVLFLGYTAFLRVKRRWWWGHTYYQADCATLDAFFLPLRQAVDKSKLPSAQVIQFRPRPR